MLYTDFDSLCLATTQTDASDIESLKRLGELFRVYLDAMDNPPAGIVGVGAITYAESVLLDFQLNEGN
jgi:hypothetical protein